MNDAHLHMLVNHFPIIGLFFGFLILLYGIIKNNATLKSTAYVIFIFCMIMGKVSMFTGEKAEHSVEEMTGFSHDYIHEHEEAAELFMKPLYVLGLVSIFGLVLQSKNNNKEKLISYLAITLVAICLFLSKSVGTSGGEIRHTEIRENTSNNGTSEVNEASESNDDNH